MIRSRSGRWLLLFALVVVVLLSACNDSADEDADSTLATASTRAPSTTLVSTTTTAVPTTTTSSAVVPGNLSISFSENPVMCDARVHRVGRILGFQPGEEIWFSSPDVSGIAGGAADFGGRVTFRWQCVSDDAGRHYRITVHSESGSSLDFVLHLTAPQTTTDTTEPAGAEAVALPIELSHSQDHSDTDFVAEGAAVVEGTMCSAGTRGETALESMDNAWLTDEDWADMFDAAMAAGTVAEVYVIDYWTCDDGSGEFTVKFHNRLDFAVFEFEGQQNVGTWGITRGNGNYTDRTGSGDVTLDWDAGRVIYTGTFQ